MEVEEDVVSSQEPMPAEVKRPKFLLQHFNYPDDVDQELVPLLDAINSIPGVRTLFSCCGHGKEHFYLVCAFTSLEVQSAFVDIFSERPNREEAFDLDCHPHVKFERNDLGDRHYCPLHYENCIGWYSEELGMMPEELRKEEYARLMHYFEKFIPKPHW